MHLKLLGDPKELLFMCIVYIDIQHIQNSNGDFKICIHLSKIINSLHVYINNLF